MHSRLWMTLIVALLLTGLTASSAMAEETPGPDFSSEPTLKHVAADLQQQWDDDPESFEHVAVAREFVDEASRRGSARLPNVARILNAGGEALLLPMLWEIAGGDLVGSGMNLRAWRHWRAGLIEAVGRLRDERSIPVLHGIVAGGEPSAQIRQVATSALGRVGDEASIQGVIEVAKESPDKRRAIVAGLGDARRLVAAEYLVDVVEQGEEDEVVAAVRALGDWANWWVWETSAMQEFGAEGEEGRRLVIRMLVEAYPSFDGRLRVEAQKSLMLAGADQARKKAASVAEESGDAALEQLIRALEASPL